MLENRFSLLEVEGADNQPQGNKRKKKESTPNQITPAQRAKINERKKKQKAVEQPITKRQADPNEKFTPVGGREDKEKAKGPKKLTREEFERERKSNPDSPLLRGLNDEEDVATTKTDDGSFSFHTRGGKTRNRGRIQDTDKEEYQKSPNPNSPSNRGQGGNKFQGGQGRNQRNQGGRNQGGKNQGGQGGKFQGQGGKNQGGQGGKFKGQGKNQGGQGKNQGGYRENHPKKYQGGGTPAVGDTQRKKKYVSEPPVHGRPDQRKPRSDVDTHKGGRGGNTSWGDDVKEQKKANEEEVNNEDLSDSDKKEEGDQVLTPKSDYIFFTEPDEEGNEKVGVPQRKGYNSFIKDMEDQQNDISKLLQKHSVETKKIEGAVGLSEVETQNIENISKKSHDIIIEQENDSWMVKKNAPIQVAEKKRKEKKQPHFIPNTDLQFRQRRHKGINMPIERTEDYDSDKPERRDRPERKERRDRPERKERTERTENENTEDPANVDSPDWGQGKRRDNQGYSDNRDQGNSPNYRDQGNSPNYRGKRGGKRGGRSGGGKQVIKNEENFPSLSQDPIVNKVPGAAWEGKRLFDLS